MKSYKMRPFQNWALYDTRQGKFYRGGIKGMTTLYERPGGKIWKTFRWVKVNIIPIRGTLKK